MRGIVLQKRCPDLMNPQDIGSVEAAGGKNWTSSSFRVLFRGITLKNEKNTASNIYGICCKKTTIGIPSVTFTA